MKKLSLLALIPLLALSACGPGRDAADAKLQQACQLAVKAMIGPDDLIEVKKSSFLSEKSPEDTQLRTVNLHVYLTENHGSIVEKDYACAFEEASGMMGYSAKFYRLDMGEEKYGNFNGEIEGSLDDMMKITDAIGGMSQQQ